MADSDITVAVATHKAYRMPIDGVYMPLQVGRALHPNVDLGMTCDNTGDNISQLNAQYSELTGLYWMWKNCDADYQGLVHYRRHFAKNDSAKTPRRRKRTLQLHRRKTRLCASARYVRNHCAGTTQLLYRNRIFTLRAHHAGRPARCDTKHYRANQFRLPRRIRRANEQNLGAPVQHVRDAQRPHQRILLVDVSHHRRTGQAYRFKLIQRLRNAISRTHQRNPLRCMAGNQPLPVRRNAYHQPRTSGLEQKGMPVSLWRNS